MSTTLVITNCSFLWHPHLLSSKELFTWKLYKTAFHIRGIKRDIRWQLRAWIMNSALHWIRYIKPFRWPVSPLSHVRLGHFQQLIVNTSTVHLLSLLTPLRGHAVAQLVEELRYKAGRSRVRFGIFHWHNPFCRTTMALGSTKPLTEMSTKNISWGVKKADA
jgi:hypothetical protein